MRIKNENEAHRYLGMSHFIDSDIKRHTWSVYSHVIIKQMKAGISSTKPNFI